jgi:hypothetical protein
MLLRPRPDTVGANLRRRMGLVLTRGAEGLAGLIALELARDGRFLIRFRLSSTRLAMAFSWANAESS